jgi:hypothetical protein
VCDLQKETRSSRLDDRELKKKDFMRQQTIKKLNIRRKNGLKGGRVSRIEWRPLRPLTPSSRVLIQFSRNIWNTSAETTHQKTSIVFSRYARTIMSCFLLTITSGRIFTSRFANARTKTTIVWFPLRRQSIANSTRGALIIRVMSTTTFTSSNLLMTRQSLCILLQMS